MVHKIEKLLVFVEKTRTPVSRTYVLQALHRDLVIAIGECEEFKRSRPWLSEDLSATVSDFINRLNIVKFQILDDMNSIGNMQGFSRVQ